MRHDVLGARLTNSEDMKRAQAWVKGKLKGAAFAFLAAMMDGRMPRKLLK